MSNKYGDLLSVDKEKQTIYFAQNQNVYPLSTMRHVQVISLTKRKKISAEIMNSIANALSDSIANGNEKKYIYLRIDFDGGREDVLFDEKLYVRGNLDYYKTMEEAQILKNTLKKYIKKVAE